MFKFLIHFELAFVCTVRLGLPQWLSGKESACSARDTDSIPGSGRSCGRGHGNPLRILPGESNGQRRLTGYSPQGHKQLDMTEATEHACRV